MLTFKVRYDTDAIASEISKRASVAETILAAQVMKDTDKYVPALTGNLTLRTHIENGNTIVYPGPYARFLYYGKVMIYAPTGSTWAPRFEHKVVIGRDLVMHKTMHPLATSHWFEVSKAANIGKWMQVAEKAVNQKNA